VKQAVKAAKGEKVEKNVYIKITGYGPDQIKQLTKPDLSDWWWIGDDQMPAEFLPQL
jgi:ABC-type sugar transport system substrate-binding protein